MLTVEYILTDLKDRTFSFRRVFWGALESRLWRESGGERFKIAWPDGLLHLSQNDWNEAFHETLSSAISARLASARAPLETSVVEKCMSATCKKPAMRGSCLCEEHYNALPAPMRGEQE